MVRDSGRGFISYWHAKWPWAWSVIIVLVLFAVAAGLVDEAHDQYDARNENSWGNFLATGLLNGALVVVLGAWVTALLGLIGEFRAHADRARDKRLGLFRRMRGAHVRVALTQEILRARPDADTYHERMRDLLEVLKDLEEVREEVRVSGRLYRSDRLTIMQGIALIIIFLQEGITQYNGWCASADEKSAPSNGWLGRLVHAPESPGKETDASKEDWQPTGNMPRAYDQGLNKSKLVMRAYVYESRR